MKANRGSTELCLTSSGVLDPRTIVRKTEEVRKTPHSVYNYISIPRTLCTLCCAPFVCVRYSSKQLREFPNLERDNYTKPIKTLFFSVSGHRNPQVR